MNKFYFDTGVSPKSGSPLYADQVWRGGTKQIPFEADAPKNATLMFLCNKPDLPESKIPNVIVREVFNTSMVSKYAYFRIFENQCDDHE